MTDISAMEGIVVGGVGGAAAGIAVYIVQFLHEKFTECMDSRRIHKWLQENTSDQDGNTFRTTRAIASWNNLTEDRVRYICSIHEKIFLSTGEAEDRWSLYQRQSSPRIRQI